VPEVPKADDNDVDLTTVNGVQVRLQMADDSEWNAEFGCWKSENRPVQSDQKRNLANAILFT
jgi:hypothetical protein